MGDRGQFELLGDRTRGEAGVNDFCDEWRDDGERFLDKLRCDGVEDRGGAVHAGHEFRALSWR